MLFLNINLLQLRTQQMSGDLLLSVPWLFKMKWLKSTFIKWRDIL